MMTLSGTRVAQLVTAALCVLTLVSCPPPPQGHPGLPLSVTRSGSPVTSYAFGATNGSSEVVLTIVNSGQATISLDPIQNTDSADFTVWSPSSASLVPAGSATFTLIFAPTVDATALSTTITVSHDGGLDPDDVQVTGEGTSGVMQLRRGDDITVVGNGTTVSAKVYIPGTTESFYIHNLSGGSGVLHLVGLTSSSLTGDTVDFSLSPPLGNSVAPGLSQTFMISECTNQHVSGTYNAKVAFQTSDAGNATFTFNLSITFIDTLPP